MDWNISGGERWLWLWQIHTNESLFPAIFPGLITMRMAGSAEVTAGAQIQAGHTVLGLEADIDWANITVPGKT